MLDPSFEIFTMGAIHDPCCHTSIPRDRLKNASLRNTVQGMASGAITQFILLEPATPPNLQPMYLRSTKAFVGNLCAMTQALNHLFKEKPQYHCHHKYSMQETCKSIWTMKSQMGQGCQYLGYSTGHGKSSTRLPVVPRRFHLPTAKYGPQFFHAVGASCLPMQITAVEYVCKDRLAKTISNASHSPFHFFLQSFHCSIGLSAIT